MVGKVHGLKRQEGGFLDRIGLEGSGYLAGLDMNLATWDDLVASGGGEDSDGQPIPDIRNLFCLLKMYVK